MYARVTTIQGNPDQIDEATNLVRDTIVPALQQRTGFEGYLLLADRGTGKGITITLWDSEADREASGPGSEAYKEVMAKVAPLLTAEPVVENLEVLVQA